MLKRIFTSPYLYIFLLGYLGVWLLWNSFKLPASSPEGIVSPLILIHYNPSNNFLRFLVAILVPPLSCLGYWLWQNYFSKSSAKTRRLFNICVITVSVLLAVGMGIFQNSTNPANNPADQYGGPYTHALVDTFHEGETLGPAISYMNPALKPYRDFVIVHGIFQDPLRSVIAFKIFGQSIGAVRAFTTILVILTLLLYYWLLLVLFRGSVMKSAFALTVVAILMLPATIIPYIGTSIIGIQFPFRDIATILFLILAISSLRWAQKKISNRKLAVTGGLIGFIMVAGYANSIDRAMYITALSALWFVILMLITDWRTVVRKVLPYFVAGCIGGFIVLGFALKWAFGAFWGYLSTMSQYKEYLDGIVFTQPPIERSLLLLTVGACIFLGGAMYVRLLPPAAKLKRSPKALFTTLLQALRTYILRYPIEIMLFSAGFFFLRNALGRSDVGHFAYSVQWLYLFVVYVTLERSKVSKKTAKTLGYLAFMLLFIMFGWYLSAVKRIDIRNDVFPVSVKDSSLVKTDYLETAQFLKNNLHKDKSFMTLTSEGIWYYLADSPSPSRYYIVWYAFTAPQRHEIAKTLADNNNVEYVITNNNWSTNFDYIPNTERFPEAYRELYDHYKPIKGIGQQTVWQRKS